MVNTLKVFVVFHDRDDEDFLSIISQLKAQFGDQNVWGKKEDVPLGVTYENMWRKYARECDILIAVIVERSDHVRATDKKRKRDLFNPGIIEQITNALERGEGCTVIPLLVNTKKLPVVTKLPEKLAPLLKRRAEIIYTDRDQEPLASSIAKFSESIKERFQRGPESPVPIIREEPEIENDPSLLKRISIWFNKANLVKDIAEWGILAFFGLIVILATFGFFATISLPELPATENIKTPESEFALTQTAAIQVAGAGTQQTQILGTGTQQVQNATETQIAGVTLTYNAIQTQIAGVTLTENVTQTQISGTETQQAQNASETQSAMTLTHSVTQTQVSGTETQEALNLTGTQQAQNASETQSAVTLTHSVTQTQISETETQEALNLAGTQQAQNATETKVAGVTLTENVTPPTVVPPTVTPPTAVPTSVTPPTVAPTSVTPPTVVPTSVTPPTVVPTSVTPPTVAPTSVTPPILTPTPIPFMPVFIPLVDSNLEYTELVTRQSYSVCYQLARSNPKKCPNPQDSWTTFVEPATNVTFRGAEKYCEFIGARLPTIAEFSQLQASPGSNITDLWERMGGADAGILLKLGSAGQTDFLGVQGQIREDVGFRCVRNQ